MDMSTVLSLITARVKATIPDAQPYVLAVQLVNNLNDNYGLIKWHK